MNWDYLEIKHGHADAPFIYSDPKMQWRHRFIPVNESSRLNCENCQWSVSSRHVAWRRYTPVELR